MQPFVCTVDNDIRIEPKSGVKLGKESTTTELPYSLEDMGNVNCNDTINGQSDPVYRLIASVRDLNSNSPGWATEETFQQPTRPAEDVKVLMKGLQELT